jgi:hypothetical protein
VTGSYGVTGIGQSHSYLCSWYGQLILESKGLQTPILLHTRQKTTKAESQLQQINSKWTVRMINYLCLFVVPLLILGGYGDLVKDRVLIPVTDRPYKWNLVADKSHRAAKHFSFSSRKETKPCIYKTINPSAEGVNRSAAHSPTLSRLRKAESLQETGHRAPLSIHSKSSPLSSQHKSSFTGASACSPRRYEINLRHLNCSKRVFTKMCQGQCDSYTFPGQASLFSVSKHRKDLKNVCYCCAAVSLRKIPHTLQCRIEHRLLKRTFFVPSVETCACVPCVIT